MAIYNSDIEAAVVTSVDNNVKENYKYNKSIKNYYKNNNYILIRLYTSKRINPDFRTLPEIKKKEITCHIFKALLGQTSLKLFPYNLPVTQWIPILIFA